MSESNLPEKFLPSVTQIRECRSLILDYVNSVYPSSLLEDDLVEVLFNLPDSIDPAYAKRDLGYLQARGLIELDVTEHPVRKTKQRRWRLTARGVTFIERQKPWSEIEAL